MSANFINAMNAMNAHYKTGTLQAFAIDDHLEHFPLAATANMVMLSATADDTADVTAAIAKITGDAKAAVSTSTSTQQTGITTACTALSDNKTSSAAPNDFITRMTAQRDQAKADAAKTIDTAYQAAIDLGKNAPEAQQNSIISGMQTLSSTINNVFSTITNFVSGLIEKVMNIINGIYDFLKGIQDTFKSIASIF
ncbi:hypothetical protein F2P45_26720 [Massilia sp. CCM 8733]|uniref:Uncharacterized protein n=1 Tax=Massilia mucilaginosa TaxID=2609282 RepID=A0ABX0NZY5_9BURK|nr:hypothetical protein [Massilia mucilaginosa]NHZ92574.1 hypothetical protein [Massilia mucilaginosa]